MRLVSQVSVIHIMSEFVWLTRTESSSTLLRRDLALSNIILGRDLFGGLGLLTSMFIQFDILWPRGLYHKRGELQRFNAVYGAPNPGTVASLPVGVGGSAENPVDDLFVLSLLNFSFAKKNISSFAGGDV